MRKRIRVYAQGSRSFNGGFQANTWLGNRNLSKRSTSFTAASRLHTGPHTYRSRSWGRRHPKSDLFKVI
jgi:hypothetical protein